jgi:hypothetical protein
MSLNGLASTKPRGPVMPNVRCPKGHPDAPGYVVCTHVVCGTKPERTIKATSKSMGEIMCGADKHSNREMVLVCVRCCVIAGYLDPLK